MNVNKISNVIIGGGFSAFVAKTIINKPCHLFFPESHTFVGIGFLFKAPSYKIKKFFSASVIPYVSLMPKFKSLTLHAYQLIGGNTNIWGGFINIKKLPPNFNKLLNNQNILAIKLDNYITGSSSNNPDIYQLQEQSGEILNVANFLRSDESFFLHSISVKNKIIKLLFMSRDTPGTTKILYANNAIIAVGVVDLIDLLFRSKLIRESCCIELSEFSYSKLFVFFKFIDSSFEDTKKTIIRFNLMRAFCHMLGIQKTLPFNWLFNLLPIYVEQRFYGPMNRVKVDLVNENLVQRASKVLHKEKVIFGSSIHYCNLKINGININNFLKAVHPGLIGLGMAFVKQNKPGPISNDIVLDAIKKLRDL
jgi:hypothetical protein